jgi:hypothetical protein
MAGNAIRLRDLTHFCRRLAARVASLAFYIVVRILAVELLVRIVAAHATDAFIVDIEAFAISQPVWLETNIAHAQQALTGNFGPRPMALSAKCGNFFGVPLSQFLHGLERGKMRLGWPVTTFALNTRHK